MVRCPRVREQIFPFPAENSVRNHLLVLSSSHEKVFFRIPCGDREMGLWYSIAFMSCPSFFKYPTLELDNAIFQMN